MYSSIEGSTTGGFTYSSPISRYYRLKERGDLVSKADLPWSFVDSNKRISSQTNRAFASDGPATALFANLRVPFLYTLYGELLGIPAKYRHARSIRSRKALKVWREALYIHFCGCYLYKFEVGLESDLLHVHVVADQYAGFLMLPRLNNQICKPITDPGGIIRYLEKPCCYPIRKRVKEYRRALKAVGESKLPKVSGYVGLPTKIGRFVTDELSSKPVTDVKNEIHKNLYIYRTLDA